MPRPQVLCVGNSSSIRRLCRLFRESKEFELVNAENGIQAMAFMNANLTINAVIIDHELLGVKGAELAAGMKLLRPHLLVILLSACAPVVQDAAHFLDAAVAKGSDAFAKVTAQLRELRATQPQTS
jgi:DNA-binding NtrC family response regulator